jgi:hypothetical protein
VVGLDSLATATVMPSMSAFVIGSGGSKHIRSIRVWKVIFREGGFHCAGTGRFAGCALLVYIQLGDIRRVAPLHRGMCEIVAVSQGGAIQYTG